MQTQIFSQTMRTKAAYQTWFSSRQQSIGTVKVFEAMYDGCVGSIVDCGNSANSPRLHPRVHILA